MAFLIFFVIGTALAAAATLTDRRFKSNPGAYPDRWWDVGTYLWAGVLTCILAALLLAA